MFTLFYSTFNTFIFIHIFHLLILLHNYFLLLSSILFLITIITYFFHTNYIFLVYFFVFGLKIL